VPTDTPSPARPTSWFLQRLVEVTSEVGVRPMVTLTVGGLLVTGELIDGKTYFNEMSEAVTEELPPGSVASSLEALLAEFAAKRTTPGSDTSAADEPLHVHIRGARVFDPSGSAVPAVGGASWRVKLSAVDAVSLNLFTADRAQTEV